MGRNSYYRGGRRTGVGRYASDGQKVGYALQGMGRAIGDFVYLMTVMKKAKTAEEAAKAKAAMEKLKPQIDEHLKNSEMYRTTGASDQEQMNHQLRGQELGLYEPAQADAQGNIITPSPALGLRTPEETGRLLYEKTLKQTQAQNLMSPAKTARESQIEMTKHAGEKTLATEEAKMKAQLWKEKKLNAYLTDWRTKMADEYGLTSYERRDWILDGKLAERLSDKDVLTLSLKTAAFAATMTPIQQIVTDSLNNELNDPATKEKRRTEITEHLSMLNSVQNQAFADIFGLVPGSDKLIDEVNRRNLGGEFDKLFNKEHDTSTPVLDYPRLLERQAALQQQIQSLKSRQQAPENPATNALNPGVEENAPY